MNNKPVLDLFLVNRIEIIDHTGRAYVNMHASDVEFSLQDQGRTLKIFCKRPENAERE